MNANQEKPILFSVPLIYKENNSTGMLLWRKLYFQGEVDGSVSKQTYVHKHCSLRQVGLPCSESTQRAKWSWRFVTGYAIFLSPWTCRDTQDNHISYKPDCSHYFSFYWNFMFNLKCCQITEKCCLWHP